MEEGVPVAFVRTKAEGVPRAGVVKVGLVVKATKPVPDSSLIRAAISEDVPP
jgi:hypothetical protein